MQLPSQYLTKPRQVAGSKLLRRSRPLSTVYLERLLFYEAEARFTSRPYVPFPEGYWLVGGDACGARRHSEALVQVTTGTC